jgi:hypothetical protein
VAIFLFLMALRNTYTAILVSEFLDCQESAIYKHHLLLSFVNIGSKPSSRPSVIPYLLERFFMLSKCEEGTLHLLDQVALSSKDKHKSPYYMTIRKTMLPSHRMVLLKLPSCYSRFFEWVSRQ